MNVTAVSMVRDEADILDHTLTRLKRQGVARFLVLDNGSTDDTATILKKHGAAVIADDEPGYYQSDKISRLAQRACDEGADWVLPFDADEAWYVPNGQTIASALVTAESDVVAAVEFKHWPTPWDTPNPDPYLSLRWRETQPHRLHKVCFRARPGATVHMGNHGVNFGPYDPDRPDPAQRLLELRHLPYRSFQQFVRKVRNGREAYEASNLHRLFGTHWREMGAASDDDLRRMWSDATSGYANGHEWLGHGDLVEDPVP